MRTAKRIFIVLSASFAVAILGWVVLIGAVYAWGGVATVQVKDANEGVNLYVPVPMALVDVAVRTPGLAEAFEALTGVALGEHGSAPVAPSDPTSRSRPGTSRR